MKLAQVYSTRLGITITTDVRPIRLEPRIEHALLRIAQEAFANATRHSNASLISLCLASEGDSVKLTITDNGKGFVANDDRDQEGLGLHLMRERVEELHGIFELKTAPGQGTSILLSVPWEKAND